MTLHARKADLFLSLSGPFPVPASPLSADPQ
jgi:hypothetical protein